MLKKLCLTGQFDQNPLENAVSSINQIEKNGRRNEFINLVFATFAASAAIALIVTPFDMVFFKTIAKTANISSKASFSKIAQEIYITQRANGSLNALGFACASTFVRYFFLLTSVSIYMNAKQ